MALVVGLVFSFATTSLADTQGIDGDLGNNTPNLIYGAGHNACSSRDTATLAALKLHFDGNPNNPLAHFGAGTAVTLSFANGPGGTATASSVGITASQTGTTNVPSPWNQSSADFTVPFMVTVPSTTPDGTYQLEVAASGTDGNGNPYSPTGGRPLFIIHVACAGGGSTVNQPPTVSDISGDTTSNEGDTKTYSVTESDPEADVLSTSWSITGGNAEIVGSNTGTSVSVHFTDGPSTVGLQVEVNDGNGNVVTKSLPIAESNVAPTVTFTSGDTPVNENKTTTHTYSYTISDPGDDTVNSVTADCGALGSTPSNATNDNSSGSFDCVFDDGHIPATASTVEAKATDSDNDTGPYGTYSVTVNNVAPTIAALTASAPSVITGQNVAFTGTATDPSQADTTAGFQWSFDGGTTWQSSNQYTTSFATCGSHTVTALAKDKDGGISDPLTSDAVSSFDAHYLPPLTEGIYNAVQKGQVVPVKINVGCNGVFLSGLHPGIQLLSGDIDPQTDPGDATLNVTTTSVSAADTTGVMREVDGQYIYNMQVPSASAGTLFTIRVRPFGTAAGGSMYVVIKIRK
jgi:PKD domain